MITRQQYINNEVSHREYYGQFVTPGLKVTVIVQIGREALLASVDEHFNDIPLRVWDSVAERVVGGYIGRMISKANGNGGVSLSEGVCAAKEAALQIVEELERMDAKSRP